MTRDRKTSNGRSARRLRLLETEFQSALKLSDDPGPQHLSIATGVAAAPWLGMLAERAAARYPELKIHVYPIVNDFFGHSITVAGLITGGDLIRQLHGMELGDRLLISQNMIRRQERDFLDDVTLQEASDALRVPVIPVESDGFQLWDAICGILPDDASLYAVPGPFNDNAQRSADRAVKPGFFASSTEKNAPSEEFYRYN